MIIIISISICIIIVIISSISIIAILLFTNYSIIRSVSNYSEIYQDIILSFFQERKLIILVIYQERVIYHHSRDILIYIYI